MHQYPRTAHTCTDPNQVFVLYSHSRTEVDCALLFTRAYSVGVLVLISVMTVMSGPIIYISGVPLYCVVVGQQSIMRVQGEAVIGPLANALVE